MADQPFIVRSGTSCSKTTFGAVAGACAPAGCWMRRPAALPINTLRVTMVVLRNGIYALSVAARLPPSPRLRRTTPPLQLMRARRQQVQGHRKDRIHHQEQHADEPGGATGTGQEDAVIVAMRIITTAPGQNCRSIGVGPRT